MSSSLKRTSDSLSTPKIVINCGEKITEENPTTKEWLNNLKYLTTIDAIKSNMSNKKILEGILDKEHSVVVKVSNKLENIKHEFDIYKHLKEHNISGIVHYYCYFECDDSLKNTNNTLCHGSGDSLRVLIMDYIKNKSFGMHNWRNKEKIKSCIKQVFCTCLDAFIKFGFIHGDLNCNNILIKNTNQKEIHYDFANIDILGYKTLLMDFEFSKINGSVTDFYKGFKFEFSSSLQNYIGRNDTVNFNALLELSRGFNNFQEKAAKKADALWILQLFTIVDKI